MESISKEFSKVEKKQQEVAESAVDNIDKMINEIREAQGRLEIGGYLNHSYNQVKQFLNTCLLQTLRTLVLL